MQISRSIPIRILLVVATLPAAAVHAQQKYPVVVTPGTPSIWSMEQAHYLLNRLRANNDSIHTKAPGESDLDPNGVNGIRLDALQTTLNVSAALDSAVGLQNQISLRQYGQNTTRHDDLVRQADALRTKLYNDQLTLAGLKGQQARLQAIQAANDARAPALPAGTPTPASTVAVSQALADLTGRITTLDGQNQATTAEIASLDQLAGASPSSPDLKTVDAPATLSPPEKLLADSVKALLAKTTSSFDRPKLQASIVLDNFLQMQYEILAKQLTSLRDEAGAEHRIIFLEMPTSIQSADRKVLGTGGEDKLAQSWWRVKRILRRFKMEDSPCWLGDDFNERFRYAGVALRRPPTADSDLGSLRLRMASGDDKTMRFFRPNPLPPEAPDDLLGRLRAMHDALKAKYAELSTLALTLNADTKDVGSAATSLATIGSALRDQRATFRALREEFISKLTGKDPIPYSKATATLDPLESGCRVTRSEYGVAVSQLEDLEKSVTDRINKTTVRAEKEQLGNLLDLLKKIRDAMSDRLSDLLGFDQARIYQAFGGPKQVSTAFYSEIEGDGAQQTTFGSASGDLRAVDLIPRQTALNVNTSHALVRNSAASFAWHALFGFGLKVDYQQQHEKYDQFMQQEAFASGFGKGQATFGWTFGPLPGTRVLNSGARNTYAVLAVPDDTSALELEGYGCAFHRKDSPPAMYPGDLNRRDEYHCGNKLSSLIEVPDRINSGGFWITDVEYQPVDPGQRVAIVLRGGYFSPQTTVLVNGRRLPQVLGLGKPALNMDSGPDDSADDGVVTGTFEYVNQEQMALSLVVPKKYEGPDFPVITLVAPSRAMTIHRLPLRINGKFSTLKDESLFNPTPGPKFALSGWQYFGVNSAQVAAHLSGQLLTDLTEVRLNGVVCRTAQPLNAALMRVECPVSSQVDWEFIALTADTDVKKRKIARLVVRNPLQISLTSFQVLDGITYDDDLHPVSVPVRLIGSGFTPRTVLAINPQVDRSRLSLSYVSPTELFCEVRNPQPTEVITVEDVGSSQGPATILVPRPKDKDKASDDQQAKETTVTTVQSEKKVVKK